MGFLRGRFLGDDNSIRHSCCPAMGQKHPMANINFEDRKRKKSNKDELKSTFVFSNKPAVYYFCAIWVKNTLDVILKNHPDIMTSENPRRRMLDFEM